MSDRFPGEPEWTDALQTEPTYDAIYTETDTYRAVQMAATLERSAMDAVIEHAQRTVGDMELEIARLTTLVAEGERREALLTELYWAILNLDAVFDGVEEEAPGGADRAFDRAGQMP